MSKAIGEDQLNAKIESNNSDEWEEGVAGEYLTATLGITHDQYHRATSGKKSYFRKYSQVEAYD
ncbi:hypothetical protein ACFQZE_08390 [Paenibacillus sp. GCM10027627]